jgi:KaiC/GvpD/RAD55 family RecA-like ATPase
MAKKRKKARQDVASCPQCGKELPEGVSECDECSGRASPDETGEGMAEGTDTLRTVPGVDEESASILHAAGYRDIMALSEASVEDLAKIEGIGPGLAEKILNETRNRTQDDLLADWLSGEEEGLSDWLSGEKKPRVTAQAMAVEAKHRSDPSLAKWLMGEEESLDGWLTHEQPVPLAEIAEEKVPLEREAEIIELREALRSKLAQLGTEGFDPDAFIEEMMSLRNGISSERARSARLEEELENVKRGSIAVIKFIKKQQGTPGKGDNLADKLASEMAMRENLERKVMELEGVVETLTRSTEQGLSEMPPDVQELKRKEIALSQKEALIEARERLLKSEEEDIADGIMSYAEGQTAQAIAGEQAMALQEEFAKKEQELLRKLAELDGQLSQANIDLKHMEETVELSKTSGSNVEAEVMRKLEEAQLIERKLVLREQEVERLKEEVRIKEDELNRLKEPLAYKEEEMIRREEDLMYRERLLQEELKKATRMQSELGSTDELTLKRRLEELQANVNTKEQEIRNKEKYLAVKEEEMRIREQGLVDEEIERREAERLAELKTEKVKTGTARLDDLLLGGVPFGSNVLIYGPPFTGKEVLVNCFISEGLKKGVPAIWVLTEKSSKDIRDEMMYILSSYEEYEKKGMVKYIDSYSRSMGDDTVDDYTTYVESPTDYETIQKAIETAAKEFKDANEYYRLAFRSISTMIAYLDPNTAFRFLSPIVGRRKRDRAVAMYTIEKGVHGEQEIQMLGSLMDGMIEFKLENLNTFLAVRGVSDVQSRAFIRYSATKQGVNIGSFSLDHIR